jgi:hypothetical protein
MTSLNPDPLIVASVQTASTLPCFCLHYRPVRSRIFPARLLIVVEVT